MSSQSNYPTSDERYAAGPKDLSRLMSLRPSPRQLPCPLCGATPGEVCIVTRGQWKGHWAKSSHKQRSAS